MNLNPPLPAPPYGRGNDIKSALQHLHLMVGGNVPVKWDRLAQFIILFPEDGLLAQMPENLQGLVNIITNYVTPDVRTQVRGLFQKEELIEVLSNRITVDLMINGTSFFLLSSPSPSPLIFFIGINGADHLSLILALNRRNAYSELTRPELVAAVIQTFKGAPIRPQDNPNSSLKTLVNFANGQFNQQEFIAGSRDWMIRQGSTFFSLFYHFPSLILSLLSPTSSRYQNCQI